MSEIDKHYIPTDCILLYNDRNGGHWHYNVLSRIFMEKKIVRLMQVANSYISPNGVFYLLFTVEYLFILWQ